MKVVIAADHRGFALKEKLKKHLLSCGFSVADGGAFVEDDGDDYPDFAYRAAREVSHASEDRGIFICGSGTGMQIAANKMPGIRAAAGSSKDAVVRARQEEDVNVLALAADTTNESLAFALANLFLSTPFSGDERHRRRIAKIQAIEHAATHRS